MLINPPITTIEKCSTSWNMPKLSGTMKPRVSREQRAANARVERGEPEHEALGPRDVDAVAPGDDLVLANRHERAADPGFHDALADDVEQHRHREKQVEHPVIALERDAEEHRCGDLDAVGAEGEPFPVNEHPLDQLGESQA